MFGYLHCTRRLQGRFPLCYISLITTMHVWCFSLTTRVKNAKAFIGACICTSNSSFPKVQDNECKYCYSKQWANNEVPLHSCLRWKRKKTKQNKKVLSYYGSTKNEGPKGKRCFLLRFNCIQDCLQLKTTTHLKRFLRLLM